jgi:hypothetical protein
MDGVRDELDELEALVDCSQDVPQDGVDWLRRLTR